MSIVMKVRAKGTVMIQPTRGQRARAGHVEHGRAIARLATRSRGASA
ncbi:hypothetical protein ABZ639_02185 [Saccharomonospora sp. NPDC006951]